MASLKETKEVIQIAQKANLKSKNGRYITPLLIGRHGEGKTQIVHEIAEEQGGECFVLDGSTMKEGDTGIPLLHVDTGTGERFIVFVPHETISKIQRTEKYYYNLFIENKLSDEIAYDADQKQYTFKGKTYKIKEKPWESHDNKYKIFDELPEREKKEILNKGIIKPIFLLIDELVRADKAVTTELMNVTLQRSLNGYDLPWFLQIVAAMNPTERTSNGPTYSGTKLDDANKDRFMKINVQVEVDEWLEYAKRVGIHELIIEAVAEYGDKLLRGEGTSPRSLELMSNVYYEFDDIKSGKDIISDLNGDEKRQKKILAIMGQGQIGENAVNLLFDFEKNYASRVQPEDIFCGNTGEIPEEAVEKFKKLKGGSRSYFLSTKVIEYLKKFIIELEKKKKEGDPKPLTIFKTRFKEFVTRKDILDDYTRINFVKGIRDTEKCEDGKKLFSKVIDAITKEILEQIGDFDNNIQKL